MKTLREAAEMPKKATPHKQLIDELLDSRIPKTEREHAAAREIERLREALAEPAPEPVVWQFRMRPDWTRNKDCWGPWKECTMDQAVMYQKVPLLHDWAYESRSLYIAPLQRKPMNKEQIDSLIFQHKSELGGKPYFASFELARAIERAHGIGGEEC